MFRDPHKSCEFRRDVLEYSRRDAYIHTHVSTRLTLASRRDMCYNHTVPKESRRVMYDDYDLDYAYTNDAQDLDEYTQDLEEDYARDGHDYESLAYRHYA